MLSEAEVGELLEPFRLHLSSRQIAQLLAYLDLLVRWNQKINLTSLRSARECVTRHFGESLYLAHWHQLQGRMLDVGSGAGFPGLALRIAFPEVRTTLLEPIAKKRAFLKEVVRTCGFDSVEIRPERWEDYFRTASGSRFDAMTARAVGGVSRLIPLAVKYLCSGGKIFLWLGPNRAEELRRAQPSICWQAGIPLPLAQKRVIICGGIPG